MRRLLDQIRGRTKDREEEPEPVVAKTPIPLLSDDRRPVTPDFSTDDRDHLAKFGLFARLPPELRWRILTEVFGDRTLHLDLRYMPIRRRERSPDGVHDSGRVPCSIKHSIMLPGMPIPYNEQCAWQWYSGVCHNQRPTNRPLTQGFNSKEGSLYSWLNADKCLEGDFGCCNEWGSASGDYPVYCDARLGAMGWLLSCRQAYLEGIAVLYGSNSFRIESRELLDALLDPTTAPRILIPRHLALIKSLEITARLNLYGKMHVVKNAIPTTVPNFVNLASTFPNLTSIIVCFPDDLYWDREIRPNGRFPEIKNALLDPLARCFAQYPADQRRFLVVELPENVFRDMIFSHEFPKVTVGEHPSKSLGTWLTYPITHQEEWEESVRDYVPTSKELAYDSVPRGWIQWPVKHELNTDPGDALNARRYFIKEGEWSTWVWNRTGGCYHIADEHWHPS